MSSSSISSSEAHTASQQLVDVVQLAVSHLSQVEDTGIDQPASKKMKMDDEEISMEQSIKQILFNINKAICLRLDAIETKLDDITVKNKQLDDKMDQVFVHLKQNGGLNLLSQNKPAQAKKNGAVIIGLPQYRDQMLDFEGELDTSNNSVNSMDQNIQNLGPNVQLITLNTEEDYPHGVWLGDENNPEMRVRVPVTPSDLLHIHSNCRTPEKMALTLLDYLFDRETQACSNLSGMGKHGKKQLDPLMIYGIRCHLIYRFSITEQDWHRMKLNIDSKCRTAHRRRYKGLPLAVKSFRGRSQPEYVHSGSLSNSTIDIDDEISAGELHIHQEGVDISGSEVMASGSATEIIHTAAGQIQVLHATPEQVAQLQQAHQIQILQGDGPQIIGLHHDEGGEPMQVAVSLSQSKHNIHVVKSENVDPLDKMQSEDSDNREL